MRKEQLEERLDPTKPSLIVLSGATKRKYMALTGELVVLGRAPGCDLGLVSAEVAPVHCIIARTSAGWRIRDCSGRATRINGRTVHDQLLNNGDVIQVGTFSFEAHLPGNAAVPHGDFADAAVVERLQNSRRHLAELALNLRRQVREARAAEADLARREHDLDEMVQRLRAGQAAPRPEQLDEVEQSGVIRRKQELDNFARHLRRLERHLREQERDQARQLEADRAAYEADLVRARVEVEHERQDLAAARAELEHSAALLEGELERSRQQVEHDRAQMVRERTFLDQQWQEVTQLRAELERRQSGPHSTHETQIDATPDRLASARRLLRQLAERRQAQSPPPPPAPGETPPG
jgi:hypothetical protein